MNGDYEEADPIIDFEFKHPMGEAPKPTFKSCPKCGLAYTPNRAFCPEHGLCTVQCCLHREFKCGDHVLLVERADQPLGRGVVVNPEPDHLGEIGVRWDFSPDTIYGQLPSDLKHDGFFFPEIIS